MPCDSAFIAGVSGAGLGGDYYSCHQSTFIHRRRVDPGAGHGHRGPDWPASIGTYLGVLLILLAPGCEPVFAAVLCLFSLRLSPETCA